MSKNDIQFIAGLVDRTKTAILDLIYVSASEIEDQQTKNVEEYNKAAVSIVDRLNSLESDLIALRCPKCVIKNRDAKVQSIETVSGNCLRLLSLLEYRHAVAKKLEQQLDSQEAEMSKLFYELHNLADNVPTIIAKETINDLLDSMTAVSLDISDSLERDSLLTERQRSLEFSTDVSLMHNYDDLRTAVELE